MAEQPTDQWQQMLAAGRQVDELYQGMDRQRLGRIWTLTEFLAAVSTDWGELVEQIMKVEGVRPGEPDIQAVKHELGDMLWALIVIADRTGVDLGAAFLETMDGLVQRFDAS